MEVKYVEKIENVKEFINDVILGAVKKNASDIHFEPREDAFYIRYRIDGNLFDVYKINLLNSSVVISRIKIISKMDITIKRLPQDGRFDIYVNNKNIDIRVSSIPVIMGEKIVMRILNSSNFEIDINNLGFYENEKEILENIIKAPNGAIIITGPTGSGKSSTLYSFIKKLKKENINIVTLEDPVEVRINGINQININKSIGVDFSVGLRSMLRQDFEIGLIGEMRDKETANIALRAAITGHLIFTTLHTSDIVSAIIRLMNLGIENYIISSSVIAILSQRLVKKLCPYCKYKRDLTSYEKLVFEKNGFKDVKYIYDKKGCENCNAGYKGRSAILEYLIFDLELKEIINKDCNSVKLYEYFNKNNNESLFKNGLRKVKDGITTFDEVNNILFSLGDFR